jgi:hypothetical protein
VILSSVPAERCTVVLPKTKGPYKEYMPYDEIMEARAA